MTRFTISLFITALLLAGSNAWADSNKQKNKGDQGQGSQQQGQSQKKNNKEYSGNKSAGKKQKSYEEDYDEDYSDIQSIFERSKSSSSYQSLPPGISKNLQRGKPLPPGIAKKFNADIENQLPYYPGKEWRQVGSDAVLIDATTSVVQEVMKGVLR